MKAISRETKWVSTDGWRGYSEPIDAVIGANDTGAWDDSPCPTTVREAELQKAKDILEQHNIPFLEVVTESSNVFCMHVYLVTHPENKDRAKELVKPLIDDAQLLYIAG